MNNRGLRTPLWLVLLLAVLLSACNEPVTTPLRVGVAPWVGYDPLVLAREKGQVDTSKVRIIELFSSAESASALRNGTLDAAALPLEEALRLADEGVALKIVGVLQVSRKAAAILAKSGTLKHSQLKGKRITLESSAQTSVALYSLLKSAGLQLSDVHLIQVEASQHEALLLSSRADAVFTFEPMKGRLLAQGYEVVLDNPEFLGEIDNVLVVAFDDWKNRRELVKELLAAWERGRLSMAADLPAAANLLAAGTDMSPKQYAKVFLSLSFQTIADSIHWLTGNPAPLVQQAAISSTILQNMNLIQSTPDWGRLIDAQPVAEVQAAMWAQP